MREALERRGLRIHYCASDVDHNRTVTAFSGEPAELRDGILELCALAFPAIDLGRHVGAHPRIGALDVCPIVPIDEPPVPSESDELQEYVESLGAEIADRWGVPVYLYEKSERGRHEADLPSLRRGGFGGLWNRELRPDFGPSAYHPHLGVTILGVRDFLLAFNVNLRPANGRAAETVAEQIRELRREGDTRFLGVRALGFALPTRELAQVSLNATLPDLTAVDPIVEYVIGEAAKAQLVFAGAELIGVIRQRDLSGATRLPVEPAQIVDGVPDESKL